MRALFAMGLCATADATLAGGRPNAFSEGQNAFAGVVNPANTVWIADRLDVGIFWVHQQSSLYNYDNNPAFLPGKTDLTYRSKGLFTADAAIHKQGKVRWGLQLLDSSITLASYAMPSLVKLRTRRPDFAQQAIVPRCFLGQKSSPGEET